MEDFMKALSVFLMTFTIFTVVTPAHDALTLFNSRPPLEAALGAHELITFEEFPVGLVEPCTPIRPFVPDPCVFTTQGITATEGRGPGNQQRPLLSIDQGIGVPLSRGLISNVISTAPDQFFLTFSHPLLQLVFRW
jgi:hypothetical protein